MTLRIVVDELVTYARAALDRPWVSAIELLPAEKIATSTLTYADALVVRSKTKVDADLLRGTPVKFVASATVGVDHVDLRSLERQGIGFAAAPGSSAASVAQFTMALIYATLARLGRSPDGLVLGVVGVGMIGSRVADAAEMLGFRVLRYDPPQRESAENHERFVEFDQLADADLLTFHVPLTTEGRHKTIRMVDASFLAHMKRGVLVCNTSRGGIVDQSALENAIVNAAVGGAALDVFENEPEIPDSLLRVLTYATPHVAGRSLEGMSKNTAVAVGALAKFFGKDDHFDPRPLYPPPPTWRRPERDVVAEWIRANWEFDQIDAMLREGIGKGAIERRSAFRRAREREPLRRDLTSFASSHNLGPEMRAFIDALPSRS
jgi:erythronate-4-phosphate dehydrogenase